MPLDNYEIIYSSFLYATFVICTAFYIYSILCGGCELGNIKRDLQVMALASSGQLLMSALNATFTSVLFNGIGSVTFFTFLYVATMMQVKLYSRLSSLSTWLKVKYVNLACKVLVFCVVGVNVCQILVTADRLINNAAETARTKVQIFHLVLCYSTGYLLHSCTPDRIPAGYIWDFFGRQLQ